MQNGDEAEGVHRRRCCYTPSKKWHCLYSLAAPAAAAAAAASSHGSPHRATSQSLNPRSHFCLMF